MKKKLFFTFIVMGFFQHCWSASNPSEWLAQIEYYMNASKTWEATFEQLNPNGSLYQGKFFLQRPGKMCLIYTYPKTQTMIADGSWLIIQDKENDELTTLALKDTPAEFFLRESIRFSEGVTVTDFSAEDGRLKVTLVRAQEPETGSLTLTFTQAPLQLIQWITIDANQLKTVVNLKDIQRDVALDPKIFVFNHPDFLLR